ncbi:MAG: HAD domain-containing protein [Rhodocyclaceae bacterium]|nr:HAD domain-containing protein [Rhodocyclaceae bacterium]
MILFLDFDGPLHPDEVYHFPGQGIVLRKANLPAEYAEAELFCHMPLLEGVLADFPGVRIVLSTSWVPAIGFDNTKARLSPALQERVIGATFHRRYTPYWHRQTRFEQIMEHVARHRLGSCWIAVDNDDWGWSKAHVGNLVLTDDYAGLGDPAVLDRLRQRLAQHYNKENKP